MTGSSADPTARFTSRAADYSEARPRYPDSLVQLLTTELALDPDSIIGDIGAGTGLFAEPFLRAGFGVVCVEPNAAMRAQAAQLLASYPGFRSAAGSAEDTGLDGDSVDLVLVAQAFHWVDTSRAQREFMRILRPPAVSPSPGTPGGEPVARSSPATKPCSGDSGRTTRRWTAEPRD